MFASIKNGAKKVVNLPVVAAKKVGNAAHRCLYEETKPASEALVENGTIVAPAQAAQYKFRG